MEIVNYSVALLKLRGSRKFFKRSAARYPVSVRFLRYGSFPATRIFLIVVGTLTLRSNKSVFPSQTTCMTAALMLLPPMRYHQPVYSGEDPGWNSEEREGRAHKKDSWAYKNLECFSLLITSLSRLGLDLNRVFAQYPPVLLELL